MLVGWQEAPGDKPPGYFRMMVWMIDGADLSVGSTYFIGICWDTSDVGHNRWDIVEAVIVTTACNPFGASRVLLRRTLGNPFIAPIRYVGITHYIGGRSRSKIFASSPHSLQTTVFPSPKCEFLLSFSSSSLQFQLPLTRMSSLREESIRRSSQNRSVNSPQCYLQAKKIGISSTQNLPYV